VTGGFIGLKTSRLKTPLARRKPEEKPDRNKTDQEEKKGFGANLGNNTDPEQDNKIKPALSPRFQTAAVN
jgi:hypothetical protein